MDTLSSSSADLRTPLLGGPDQAPTTGDVCLQVIEEAAPEADAEQLEGDDVEAAKRQDEKKPIVYEGKPYDTVDEVTKQKKKDADFIKHHDLTQKLKDIEAHDQYLTWKKGYDDWRKGGAHGAHGEVDGSTDQQAVVALKKESSRQGLAKDSMKPEEFAKHVVDEETVLKKMWLTKEEVGLVASLHDKVVKYHRERSYWIATTFLEGSVLFTIAAALGYYTKNDKFVASHEFSLMSSPNFFGACLYTIGAFLSLDQVGHILYEKARVERRLLYANAPDGKKKERKLATWRKLYQYLPFKYNPNEALLEARLLMENLDFGKFIEHSESVEAFDTEISQLELAVEAREPSQTSQLEAREPSQFLHLHGPTDSLAIGMRRPSMAKSVHRILQKHGWLGWTFLSKGKDGKFWRLTSKGKDHIKIRDAFRDVKDALDAGVEDFSQSSHSSVTVMAYLAQTVGEPEHDPTSKAQIVQRILEEQNNGWDEAKFKRLLSQSLLDSLKQAMATYISTEQWQAGTVEDLKEDIDRLHALQLGKEAMRKFGNLEADEDFLNKIEATSAQDFLTRHLEDRDVKIVKGILDKSKPANYEWDKPLSLQSFSELKAHIETEAGEEDEPLSKTVVHGASAYAIGAILFQIACTATMIPPSWLKSFSGLDHTPPWLTDWPAFCGALLFVAGSLCEFTVNRHMFGDAIKSLYFSNLCTIKRRDGCKAVRAHLLSTFSEPTWCVCCWFLLGGVNFAIAYYNSVFGADDLDTLAWVALPFLVGSFGYAAGSVFLFVLWKEQQFGFTLLRAVNKAKIKKLDVDTLSKKMTFSNRGICFQVLNSLVASVALTNLFLSAASTWQRDTTGCQSWPFCAQYDTASVYLVVGTFWSDIGTVMLAHMSYLFSSAFPRPPDKNPMWGIAQLMRCSVCVMGVGSSFHLYGRLRQLDVVESISANTTNITNH